jgi:hypothetical protein
MDGADVFEFLTARRPNADEMLQALQLLMIGGEHGTHRETGRVLELDLRASQRQAACVPVDA